jgi:hypothetical protein
MMTASSCLCGDLVWASRASCYWMLNPPVFCAITPGSVFRAKSALSTCAQFVASNKRGSESGSFPSAHMASCADEVERNQSNLVAHCRCFGAFVARAAADHAPQERELI